MTNRPDGAPQENPAARSSPDSPLARDERRGPLSRKSRPVNAIDRKEMCQLATECCPTDMARLIDLIDDPEPL